MGKVGPAPREENKERENSQAAELRSLLESPPRTWQAKWGMDHQEFVAKDTSLSGCAVARRGRGEAREKRWRAGEMEGL